VSYCMRCSAWVCRLWLAVVLWICAVSSHSARSSRHSSTRPQPTTAYKPRQNTTCNSTRSYSPDDVHNDARNMLRKKFDNKHLISCILLVPSLHLKFTMHGHKILNLIRLSLLSHVTLIYITCNNIPGHKTLLIPCNVGGN